MIFNHALVPTGDEDEMLNAGLPRLIHHMLDERSIHDRKHLFRHGLGCRQKTGSKAGDGKYGFTDAGHARFSLAMRVMKSSRREKARVGAGVQMRLEKIRPLTP